MEWVVSLCKLDQRLALSLVLVDQSLRLYQSLLVLDGLGFCLEPLRLGFVLTTERVHNCCYDCIDASTKATQRLGLPQRLNVGPYSDSTRITMTVACGKLLHLGADLAPIHM